MAIWRKVIVSGSSAELAALKVDNLTSGQVVIGGGTTGNLSTTAINGTGNIVATTNATGLVHSGSFSGSFAGPLTGTASFASSASFAISASFASTSSLPLRGIITASVNASTITFTKGDNSQFDILVAQGVASSTATITMNNITTAGIYYPTFVISGSSSQSLFVNSASFQYNVGTNTLSTTASWAASASVAISSSFASTASFFRETDPVFNAASSSLATTGSNTFRGTQTISGSLVITGSAALTGSFNILGIVSASGYSGSLFGTASWATSASNAVSSAFASTAASANSLANALTFAIGLSGSAATYNGSAAVSVAISGAAALSTNNIPKWSGTGLQNSNISDSGTTVTIASGSIISAGGLNVTGNSTFQNNLTVQGDLAVNGTTTFINTTNTFIKDQFVTLFSGSNALGDGGIIVQYSTGSGGGPTGSAFFLESVNTSTFGRWAVASGVAGNATAVTADEYMVSTKISTNANPSNATPPTWGGSANGSGNMWINDSTGDIFIYS
jgi:hypothetical protein